MPARATVYSQPNCQPCKAMKHRLAALQVPYTERNIREDADALAELHVFYEACAPDRHPATPVVVIDDADGHGSREILFGLALDELKALVRDGRIILQEAA